jgi:glucokinase
MDFGGTKIAVAVCDLAGNKIASATVQSGGEHGARASLSRGLTAARELLAETAPTARLAAIGVSTFGIPREDGVELAPAIDGWSELRLGHELRAEFPGIPVAMTTDAKAAAQAEARWGALAGYDPAVYLNLGTGLATAIVARGEVVAGSHGAAGEIGYNLRSVADVGLTLDQRTMLEQMVSGQGLSSRASSADRLGDDGDPMTTADVFTAEASDAALASLVDEFLDELAFHLVNVAILVDPARIAVGGGMVGSWDRIAPRLREALDAGVPYPPELVVAKFPQEAPLLGAVALAVDAAAAEPGNRIANHQPALWADSVRIDPSTQMEDQTGAALGPVASNKGIAV